MDGEVKSNGAPATKRTNNSFNLLANLNGLSLNEHGATTQVPTWPPVAAAPSEFLITERLALDCEMVGVGVGGKEHMVARVSIVNERGDVLVDTYVKPQQAVTDYRTCVSGIIPEMIATGCDFAAVRNTVKRLIHHRILVGHALRNDLRVLQLMHPKVLTRDTAQFRPIANRIHVYGTPSLKTLSRLILGEEIQCGMHDSVEDARAAMKIYLTFQPEWERSIQRKTQGR